MKSEELKTVRKDYDRDKLSEEEITENPFELFEMWLAHAKEADPNHFNAMTLSTIGEDGFPHSRVVLLRDAKNGAFSFFTNYESTKSKDIENYPKVSLNFFWKELERQVRIEGTAEQVSVQESDDYFATRPRESQIGAWASDQSSRLESREELEKRVEQFSKKFKGKNIPRPPFWGGFKITPVYFEFWQGRMSRLHDRIDYRLTSEKKWMHKRLFP
ncbi:pyridoxamine 5'-phosphate oxidase [Halocola ammonii]